MKRGAERASVGSASRTLEVLLAFTRTRHTLSSRDISELTGIALPSVYRYLALLRSAGLVVADRQGAFHLSMRLVSLAEAAEAADPLIEIADPVMRELAALTGETVLLVQTVGSSAMCVHRIESSHRLRTSYQPGQPVPLEHGASARILVGAMAEGLRQSVFDRVAERDARAAELLREGVDLAAARGWATSSGEVDTGIWATAAAVRDSAGDVVAALSLPIPLVRAPERERDRILARVLEAAERLSQALDGDAR